MCFKRIFFIFCQQSVQIYKNLFLKLYNHFKDAFPIATTLLLKIPLDFFGVNLLLKIIQHSGEGSDVLHVRFVLQRTANSETTAGEPSPMNAIDFAIGIGTSNYRPGVGNLLRPKSHFSPNPTIERATRAT